MAKNFNRLLAQVEARPGAPERLAAARADTLAEIAGYDATLVQIRKARALTQSQLATILEVSQPEVSRIEHQSDVFVSTLRSYLDAMGAELDLVATFADGTTVTIAMDDATDAAFGKAYIGEGATRRVVAAVHTPPSQGLREPAPPRPRKPTKKAASERTTVKKVAATKKLATPPRPRVGTRRG